MAEDDVSYGIYPNPEKQMPGVMNIWNGRPVGSIRSLLFHLEAIITGLLSWFDVDGVCSYIYIYICQYIGYTGLGRWALSSLMTLASRGIRSAVIMDILGYCSQYQMAILWRSGTVIFFFFSPSGLDSCTTLSKIWIVQKHTCPWVMLRYIILCNKSFVRTL